MSRVEGSDPSTSLGTIAAVRQAGSQEERAAHAEAALAVLAGVTPSGSARNEERSVPLDCFHWLPTALHLAQETEVDPQGHPRPFEPRLRLDNDVGEAVGAVQQVRQSAVGQIGLIWLAGRHRSTVNGQTQVRTVFAPLVRRRALVGQGGLLGTGWLLTAIGDCSITRLIDDGAQARDLENRFGQIEALARGSLARFDETSLALVARMPTLRGFLADAAAAAGFPGAPLVAMSSVEELVARDSVGIVLGTGFFLDVAPSATTRSGELLVWTRDQLRTRTAFHAVYTDGGVTGTVPSGRPHAPMPLTPRQVQAVQRSAAEPLTVVSGAPGTGKTHTIVALVCDALARGESVLVAARSEAAVDAISSHLARRPGLVPVMFGSAQQRATLANRLASGEHAALPATEIAHAREAVVAAQSALAAAQDEARTALRQEWLTTPVGRQHLDRSREAAPGLDLTAPVDHVRALVASARTPTSGWFASRRRKRALRRVRDVVQAPITVSDADVLEAIDVLTAATAAPGSRAPSPTEACARVVDAEDALYSHTTVWLAKELRSPSRLDKEGVAAIGVLTTALRSGRSARRAQLQLLTDRSLTNALPLWVGTLGDVDDLLPPVPGLFDLVVVDEASSTDQTVAATTLLRGRRAVVAGDPRQLRHVSFLSDDAMSAALDARSITGTRRSQLDVRRNSLFDAAAAAAPVTLLDEHHRCLPHLIDVVARTIYDNAVTVATRSPVTHDADCVHLAPVAGERSGDGVVAAEVDAVMRHVRSLRGIATSVGVMSPFRAQADAIEAAALASMTAQELIAMDLRVGTVHSFQGNERSTVICSLGIVDGDAGGWRFVDDPHLQAVMLTRAQHQMHMVSSCTPAPGSVLGQYLAAADAPPGAPRPVRPLGRWAQAVADDLRHAGVEVFESYPTGRHVVDIATRRGRAPLAVICELHPDGIDAHIDRHVSLLRAGWDVVDALASQWENRRTDLTVDLARSIRAAENSAP